MSLIAAIDLGNTALKVAWFQDLELKRFERREGLAPAAAVDWVDGELGAQPVDGIAIASVVPAWQRELERLARRAPCATVGQDLLKTRTRSAASLHGLGADRWMAAEAAFAPGRAVVAVALGTATTFTLVDGAGSIVGGAIAPGLSTGASSLAKAGAQLFTVPLEVPLRAIGADTSAALQSGLVLGHAAMVEGLVARMELEWGSPLSVALTGGWAERLRPVLPSRFTWDPHLVLRGLAQAAQLTWPSRGAAP